MKRKEKRDGKKKKNIRVGVDPPIPLDEKHGDKCQLDQVVDFGTDLACSVRPAKGWLRDLMISILDRHLILDSNRLIIGCCAISSVLFYSFIRFLHTLQPFPFSFFSFSMCVSFLPFYFFRSWVYAFNVCSILSQYNSISPPLIPSTVGWSEIRCHMYFFFLF